MMGPSRIPDNWIGPLRGDEDPGVALRQDVANWMVRMDGEARRTSDWTRKASGMAQAHYRYRPVHRDDTDICPKCSQHLGQDVPWPCVVAAGLGLKG